MYVCCLCVIPYYIYTTTRFTSFAKVKVIIKAEEGIAVLCHLSLFSGANLIQFFYSAKQKSDFFCLSATKSYFPTHRRRRSPVLKRANNKADGPYFTSKKSLSLRTKAFYTPDKSLFYGIQNYFQVMKIYNQALKINYQALKIYFLSLIIILDAVSGCFRCRIRIFYMPQENVLFPIGDYFAARRYNKYV